MLALAKLQGRVPTSLIEPDPQAFTHLVRFFWFCFERSLNPLTLVPGTPGRSLLVWTPSAPITASVFLRLISWFQGRREHLSAAL